MLSNWGKKMNILFLVKDMEYGIGGVCTQILALSREYIQEGHKVMLVAEGTDFLKEIQETGILFFDNVRMKSIRFNPVSFYNAYKTIKDIIEKYDVDIVHVHTQSALPIAFFLKKRTNIPYLWTNHINDIPNPGMLKEFHRMFKFPVISVSESCKEDLISRIKINEEYITVIPNGINLNDFSPLSQEEKNQLKRMFNMGDEYYNICILSRVAYNKGHDILVRAIDVIQERGTIPNIQLTIAGTMHEKEWFEREVEPFARQHNIRVNYIGFQKPRDVFGVADLFVLPSRKEGFPMVCIEAFAMHCPVVRSNAPGWQEMTEFARIVNIGEVEALADAIVMAYQEKETTAIMAEAGYQAVLKRYNSKAMANSTMSVYKQIIKGEWPNLRTKASITDNLDEKTDK